ncbi:hypothetical protein MBLNU230_g1886t1 [Neophaeotheca triangularis]
MVTVALAGASTGFGLTMLRVFFATNKETQKHKLVLLSRTPQPSLAAQGVQVRPIDYSIHAQLVHALRDVHTVLSTVGGNAEAILRSQLALLRAAKEAGVKRFAPSKYGGAGPVPDVDLFRPKVEVWAAAQASGLEWTRFACGLFMSIFATGTPKNVTEVGIDEGAATGEEEALAGLRPWNYIFNMRAGTVEMPGTGEAVFTVTDTRDVARFVYEALELESWPKELGMYGDRLSLLEAVRIIEEVQGRKLLIKESSIADMQREMHEDPSKIFYNQTRMMLIDGYFDVPGDLNGLYPLVKPNTVRGFVEKWWSGVELPESGWQSENQSFNFT